MEFYPALFPLVFVAFWVGICLLLSASGGWARLARQYPLNSLSSFDKWHFQGCRVGWVGYNGCVTFGTNFNGIYVGLWWIFRPGHPPMEIPFSDISGQLKHGWLFSFVDLEFTRSGSRMRVLQRVADRFEQAAGGNWRYDRGDGPA